MRINLTLRLIVVALLVVKDEGSICKAEGQIQSTIFELEAKLEAIDEEIVRTKNQCLNSGLKLEHLKPKRSLEHVRL